MDDTGSSFLNVLQTDVDLLHLLNPSHQGVGLGFQRMELAVGHVNCASVLMEAAIFSKNGETLVNWTAIQAVILPAHLGAQAEHRSSGQWWRKIVASVTVPDKLNRMFICSERSDLNDTAKIPDFGPQDEVPQNIMYRPPAWGPGFFPLPPPLSYTTNWAITRPNRPPPGSRHKSTQTNPPELGLSDMVGVFTKPIPAKPKSPGVSVVSAVSGAPINPVTTGTGSPAIPVTTGTGTPVIPITTGTGTPVIPAITGTGTGTPTNPDSTGLGISTSPAAHGTGSAIGTGTSISSDTTGGGVSIGTGAPIGTGGSINAVTASITASASPAAPGTGVAPGPGIAPGPGVVPGPGVAPGTHTQPQSSRGRRIVDRVKKSTRKAARNAQHLFMFGETSRRRAHGYTPGAAAAAAPVAGPPPGPPMASGALMGAAPGVTGSKTVGGSGA